MRSAQLFRRVLSEIIAAQLDNIRLALYWPDIVKNSGLKFHLTSGGEPVKGKKKSDALSTECALVIPQGIVIVKSRFSPVANFSEMSGTEVLADYLVLECSECNKCSRKCELIATIQADKFLFPGDCVMFPGSRFYSERLKKQVFVHVIDSEISHLKDFVQHVSLP
ncbi:MAG: hypothetical protein QW561_03975 [Candidatus Aenigmatarchaeota archaeon]